MLFELPDSWKHNPTISYSVILSVNNAELIDAENKLRVIHYEAAQAHRNKGGKILAISLRSKAKVAQLD